MLIGICNVIFSKSYTKLFQKKENWKNGMSFVAG